jgi:hypothetical protein
MVGPKVVQDKRNERYSEVLNDIAQIDRPSGADLNFLVIESEGFKWNGDRYGRGDIMAINSNHPRLEAMLLMGKIVADSSGRKPKNR